MLGNLARLCDPGAMPMSSFVQSRVCWSFIRLPFIIIGAAALAAGMTASAERPQDAIDRALAHVGLDKSTARFDQDDLAVFGNSEFQLAFFQALHRNPWKIPFYADATSTELKAAARTLGPLVTYGSRRVDELARRGLIDNPAAGFAKKAAAADGLANAIGAVCAETGKPLSDEQQGRLKQAAAVVPKAVAVQAATILYGCIDAYQWRQRAFATAAKRYDLHKLFKSVCTSLDSDDLDPQIYDLMHIVDFKALYVGAEDLALTIDQAVAEFKKFDGQEKFAFRWETPIGWVEINGAGDDTYPAGIKRLLTIDTGGDDTYAGGGATLDADNPISVLIDLHGNDTYRSDDPVLPSFGAGVFGYGFLVDLAGRDTYTAVNLSQGSGAFGVGCLLDFEGNDRYTARAYAQGCGQFGIGILSDIAGDDHYEGFTCLQGYGYTKGFGLLLDLAGNDEYIANDTKIDFPSPQTPQHNVSAAQGCGMGRRADYLDGHSLAGGIGILLDGEGDDKYSAGLFAQGVGFWFATGMLLDDKGNDHYRGVWYVQGSGAHTGVGVLVDGGGNDEYVATMNMAQGAGHDFTVGFLLDKSGDDRYEAPNLSLGAANANGIGIFWDMGGKDTFVVQGGTTMGQANYEAPGLRPGILSLGLFLHTGGADDTYPAAIKRVGNNKVWVQPLPREARPDARLKGVGVDE